ncbi:MAG: cysteine desulfurase family protein [Cyanobacteria bacterium P01_D01_bin.73]
MSIYLDHSATTPPCPEAIAAMNEILQDQWGNPSSTHRWGERSAMALEMARVQVGVLIGADPTEVFFTSGGTESDNWALMGIARQYREPQHLVISSVEHSAIAKTADFLETQGWDVTRLPVNHQGRVNPLDLSAALRPDTALVSIIHGQSEVGTLQPIEELGAIARDAGVLFHVDAVQTAGRVPIDVQTLPIDLLSLSSHKIYGPQGAGALFVRSGVEIMPLFFGGGQEGRLRAGTQAVAAIAGFGAAAERIAQELATESQRLTTLRDRLFAGLASCAGLQPTGDRRHRLPHHASFCLDLASWKNINTPPSGWDLVRQFNSASIAVSSGSACNSGTLSPSPVLLAMGYGETEAIGALRFSLGRSTQMADIDWTIQVVRQILKQLGCSAIRKSALTSARSKASVSSKVSVS